MKGIILAGGTGSRLFPVTKAITKQLLPIFDKPMIYYPLSTLMLAGIRDILLICTREDLSRFQAVLGDGQSYGLNISYKIQEKPNGLAEAFILGEEFVGNDCAALVLGDNIFYGHGFSDLLKNSVKQIQTQGGARVFGYYVDEPQHYGVVGFDSQGRANSLEEKPKVPKSNYAVVGLYFYDANVCKLAKTLKPSARGELEITDLNRLYLDQGKLSVELMGRGYAWLDTGTHDSLLQASQFIETIQKRTGLQVACIEEIAYYKKFIERDQLINLSEKMGKNHYAAYLRKVAEGERIHL
jgi:glucose-1-phosphate thymidylyltransferase